MSNPIYDELSDRRGVDVPVNPITWEPATMTTGSLEQTVGGVSRAAGVQYAGYRYYPLAVPRPELVGVPERADGWCEDRPPDHLTDSDGVD